MPKVRTTVTLDEQVMTAVRVKAARAGKADSEVIEEALRRDLGLDLLEAVTPQEAREFLDVLHTQAGILQDPPDAPAVASPDPDDDYLIALAAAAPAVLVSGDSDLLGLADRIPVHTPAAFLAMISTT